MSDIVVREESKSAMALSEMKAMADSIAKSGLFAMKTPEQALALMLISQANGQHPARACQEYSIIQGRAALSSQAMLAKFQQAGGRVKWIERTDRVAEAEFSHEAGGTLKVRWTIEQATKIGLAGKDNWKNYPRQMLSARVIAEGVRAILPGVILGFYAPEEVQDFAPEHDAPVPEKVVIRAPMPLPAPKPPAQEPTHEPEEVEAVVVEEPAKPMPSIAKAVEAATKGVAKAGPSKLAPGYQTTTTYGEIKTKEGQSAKGPWTRYYIKAADGEFYSTFDRNLAERMDRFVGQKVVISYRLKDGPTGQSRDITDVDEAHDEVPDAGADDAKVEAPF